MVNIYIYYKVFLWPFIVEEDFVLGNSLFGALKLTKYTTNFDKYKYPGYGLAFEAHESFLLSDSSGFHNNIIKFGADMSSFVHIDKKKDNPILGKGPRGGIDDNTLSAEKECS